jgi:UDP-N-acetylmuramate dehydrogenase
VLLSITLMDGAGNVRSVNREEVPFGYRTAGIPRDCLIISTRLRLGKDSPGAVSRRIEDFRRDKRSRQPLGQRSAGCVFKNPEGSPAGRLIDEAGLKGMRKGDIEVSGLHANFFINRGRGRAEDFVRLMEEVASEVKAHSGVLLEPEIRIVGRW